MAFLKYCYVDVINDLSAEDIFKIYKKGVDEIRSLKPEVKIIHFTMPLMVEKAGIKEWFINLFGVSDSVKFNIQRNEYNDLLKKNYAEEDIFDIAALESLRPDGTWQSFQYKGKPYLSMYSGYSDDGGHLNKMAKKYIAEKLLIFLALF